MSSTTYVRFEVLRTFRNVRFFIFSLVFPVVLYVVVVGGNRNVTDFAGTGLAFALYYMVGMVALGGDGGRHRRRCADRGRALDRLGPPAAPDSAAGADVLRREGAQRVQLALVSIVLLYGVGIASACGCRCASWGADDAADPDRADPVRGDRHLVRARADRRQLGPALGGVTALFALLGGAWGPIAGANGFVHDIARAGALVLAGAGRALGVHR